MGEYCTWSDKWTVHRGSTKVLDWDKRSTLPELRDTRSYKYLEISVSWEELEFIEIYDTRFPTCLPVAPVDMEATYAYIIHINYKLSITHLEVIYMLEFQF